MYRTEIHIRGKLGANWSGWFSEMHIQSCSADETMLHGNLPDMAAVYGVISRLGSLVVTLVSVQCIEEMDSDATIERNTKL